MNRRLAVVAGIAAASSIALFGGQADAYWWNVTLPAVVTPTSTLDLAGACVPEYAAAGIGNATALTYAIEGAGYGPANTAAIQVGCRLWDSDIGAPLGTWESGFKAGPAATLDATFTVDSLDDLVTCVSIDRIDAGGYLISTGWIATDGSDCG